MKSQFLIKQDSLLYETPQAKVLSIDASSVLCQSATITDLEDGGTVDWFNE